MSERFYTIGGYLLFITIASVVIGIGTYLYSGIAETSQVCPVVTLRAWVELEPLPARAYLIINLKPGYTIDDLAASEPFRTRIEDILTDDCNYTSEDGVWNLVAKHGDFTIYCLPIKVITNDKPVKITGQIRVTLYTSEECFPPEWLDFETL